MISLRTALGSLGTDPLAFIPIIAQVLSANTELRNTDIAFFLFLKSRPEEFNYITPSGSYIL